MASQQVKSLNMKKLSFTESQLPSDFFKPLTATSDYRKTLQSKAYVTQNTHHSINNITNSDGLSHILSNNSTVKFEKGKSSRSFKMAIETQGVKENPSKPSTTLAEIYAPLSPSSKEIASHRPMKSVSHGIRSPLDVKSLSPSYNNLKQIVKSSARVNPVGFGNLTETVNKKMEEINYLRKSIHDLKNKKQELIHKEKELLDEIDTQPVIEQEIAQKDKIIEVYEKLLRLCSKKPRSPTKAVLGEYDPITDDLRNRVLQAQKNEISSNLRKLIFVDTHFNTVSTPKSMHEFPNSAKIYPHSPSARIGGASFFESKTPSQEVDSAKDHARRLSLSHRSSSHRTSQFLQKNNRVRKVDISPGHRLVFKSSKQGSISSPKMVFSRSLNPSVEIGAQDSTLEKEDFTGTNETSDVYSRETDIYTNPSIHRRKGKTSGKAESEPEICSQLGSVVEKFKNVFKKYEEGNVALIKMNEELRKKINHFCVSKNALSS